MYMYDSISLHSFFLKSEIFHTRVVVKIKTHILYSIMFFLNNHAIYVITWTNMVEADRPKMTI
jgi:hypothetical protein